jgi:hypothetical protein
MEIYRDFQELLALFNVHGVEYVIVGGYALAMHGAPRSTGDIDLFINPAPANAERVVAALSAFGFASLGFKPEDFSRPGQIVQLGVSPVRIDILTEIDGVTWEQVDHGKVPSDYGGVPIRLIGRREFVANKRASGRLKDLADLEALGEK